MAILLTMLVLIFGAGLAYLLWVIRAGLKRQWRKVTILITTPIMIVALLCVWSWTSHHFAYKRYLTGLFDTQVHLGSPIYAYEPARAFNGDGYSICVYELPNNIRNRFASPDKQLFENFPKKPGYRSQWETIHWRRGPFDPSLNEFLQFALSTYDAKNEKALAGQFNSIENAIAKPTTFYAFFYNWPSGHLGDIDFFVIDLEAGKLYLINQNT